jgi:hypothetical protein
MVTRLQFCPLRQVSSEGCCASLVGQCLNYRHRTCFTPLRAPVSPPSCAVSSQSVSLNKDEAAVTAPMSTREG